MCRSGVGQGGCEPRNEVIVKFEEKKLGGGGGSGCGVWFGASRRGVGREGMG